MVNERFLGVRLDDYLSWKGQNEMVADLDMHRYTIGNLKTLGSSSDPADSQQKIHGRRLATKLNAIAERDLNMNNNGSTDVAWPLKNEDVRSKHYTVRP